MYIDPQLINKEKSSIYLLNSWVLQCARLQKQYPPEGLWDIRHLGPETDKKLIKFQVYIVKW